MSDALVHWQAGGWAIGFILIWLALGCGSVVVVGWWLSRLWRRRTDLGSGKRMLALIVGALALFGALGTLAGLVKALVGMTGEGAEPSQKARLLAEGISEAINCTAFGILLGVPSSIALALLTRRRDRKAI